MGTKKQSGSHAPIGIFDSGIGGLTVANAIKNILPDESLIYFGDTAHLPYGDKSPEAIIGYSTRIADFLITQGCKMIVIACNTASSVAYKAVKKHCANRAVVIDVINPVVDKVSTRRGSAVIGVIGTRGTVKSNAYPVKLLEKNPALQVASLATPLLAPMIEEGFYNNSISQTIIFNYLSRPKLKGIDTLILACTHYPLIKNEIKEFYKKGITIVDSAEIVAEKVKSQLAKNNLLNSNGETVHRFYISDYTKSFEKSTRIFFQGRIKLHRMNLWE